MIQTTPAIPFILDLPWRSPLEAFAPVSRQPYAALFDGSGEHQLSEWSYIVASPISIIEIWPDDACDALALTKALLAPFKRPSNTDLPPFSGGLAGLLSYEFGARLDRLPRVVSKEDGVSGSTRLGWPDLAFGLYDCVAAFNLAEKRVQIVSWGWQPDGYNNPLLARSRAEALATALISRTSSEGAIPSSDAGWVAPGNAWSRADYARKVRRTIDYIAAGDCFQANISQGFAGALPAHADPFDLYQRLAKRSEAPFTAFWRSHDRAIVSNSPERLVNLSPRADGLYAESRPIKGTAPRGTDSALDAALAAALQASEKDIAENLMIVDLLRNDLARVCSPGSVRVPALYRLETFSNVHHLVSVVSGKLQPSLDAFDLLRACFPGGSITGAPKIRAAEIIAELEDEPRGPYYGSLVWLDASGGMDASLLIRTVGCAKDGDTWSISMRSGGGITIGSDPDAEVQESFDKAKAILTAISADA